MRSPHSSISCEHWRASIKLRPNSRAHAYYNQETRAHLAANDDVVAAGVHGQAGEAAAGGQLLASACLARLYTRTCCARPRRRRAWPGGTRLRATRPRFLRKGFWLARRDSWCTSTACAQQQPPASQSAPYFCLQHCTPWAPAYTIHQ